MRSSCEPPQRRRRRRCRGDRLIVGLHEPRSEHSPGVGAMTWKHNLRLVSIASAALMFTASVAGAQTTFGFNIMDLDRPNGSPWIGKASYTFQSEDGDAAKSITVT